MNMVALSEASLFAGRYRIGKSIAHGGMGAVYEATHTETERRCALKVMLPDLVQSQEMRDRFRQEARVAAQVQSEFIVDVFDAGIDEATRMPFLVMELLVGEELHKRLKRVGPLEPKDVATYIHQAALALDKTHKANIVHRDLKPANIVLRQTSTGIVPTIIDLGIGKAAATVGDPELCATLTATGQVLGTPQYMSYEQALGQRDIDARSDVWALGVILYEMLVGKRPFDAPNTNAVLAAIRRSAVKPIREVASDVPEAVVHVVERCLTPDRSARFDDAHALALALEAAMKEPQRATPVQPRRRRRRFVVALAVGGLVLPVVVIVAVWPENVMPPVASEVHVSSNQASTSSATSAPSSSAAIVLPISPSMQSSAPPVIPSTVRKTAGVKRAGAPLTRVDEAGF